MIIHTDNTPAMFFVNKGTCSNPAAMDWLREIFWLSATYNIHIVARHVRGVDNEAADAISRFDDPRQLSKFLQYYSLGLNFSGTC